MALFGDFLVTFNTLLSFFLLLSLTSWDASSMAFAQSTTVASPAKKDQHTLCRGSSYGVNLSEAGDLYDHYRTRYTNCTYVDGNLELVFLYKNYDLSFLKDIREVTGYVLIVSVLSDFLSLTNLRIIRGQSLYKYNGMEYSLFVALNYRSGGSPLGLKELQFVSLHEILAGNVFFHNNPYLCFEDTIEWQDILPDASIVVHNNTLPKSRICPSCDQSCLFQNKPHCWGSGPSMCQKMTRLNCSQQCTRGCLVTSPSTCCHSGCVGGCTGPTSNMCWACRYFENEGACVQACPPQFIYRSDLFKHVLNPAFKYSHGSVCLEKCPNYLIADRGACVRECEAGLMELNHKCVPCDGTCPKQCMGTKAPDFIHSGNIANFSGCTIIQGSVSILQSSFTGDPHRNLAGISENDLSVFETVKEITGYLQIEADAITHLDYFRNLRVIRGTETIPSSAISLKIFDTQLKSLDFQSLEEIQYGNVVILNNSLLCYVSSINWHTRFSSSEQMSFVSNQKESICEESNQTCCPECSSDGCWGPRDDQCLSCAFFSLDKQCLRSCDAIPGVYQLSPTQCERCHPECITGCTDNSSTSCDSCKHFKDGPYCVPECPERKYPDEHNICQPCHANCEGNCTGGFNSVGPGACNTCAFVILDATDNITGCLPVDSTCEDGYFKNPLQGHRIKELNGKQACKPCHAECRSCDGHGLSLSLCKSCLHFQQDDLCVRNCSTDYYIKNQTNICLRCDSRCLHCIGPTASDCTVCKQYMVYHDMDDQAKGFNCTETCPDHAPHKIIKEFVPGEKVTVCVKDAGNGPDPKTIGKIVGCVIGGVIFLSIVVIVIVVISYKRAQEEADKVKLTAQLFGVPEMEPLVPSGVRPDLAILRVIKESELRRGAIMGSGAFGTVYKGLWLPENENVKLVVAIKVLAEGNSPSQTKELLEEARVMASVNDQYCIRILAFCMSAQMMIITQLMPHGCLLDFVRKHKTEISSKDLLNWCTQIAKGMAYLEEKSIVHRDLAARNILVQHPEHLRITDFGLSKLLDYNENVVHSTEDRKVPIKWMALESILNRTFTHKSDVWSYGVTLWELFTYGGVPYENIRFEDCAIKIPDVLEKGERLPQPTICTIDVYMLMIKCWVIDSTSRPGFRYLAEEFAKMARDPGRYLVIEGDEHMRLSSQKYEMKDLIRCLSMDSGGEEMIVTADDYLHPRGRMRSSGSQGRPDHLEMVAETNIDEVDGSPVAAASSRSVDEAAYRSADAQRMRRNSRNRDASNSIMRQHSAPGGPKLKNSRYCSDPCKDALQQQLLIQNAAFVPQNNVSPIQELENHDGAKSASIGAINLNSGASTSPNARATPGHDAPLSPRLPVERQPSDEEGDYLYPAEENKPTKYVDLMDNSLYDDGRGSNDYAGANPMTSFISNPEYFEDISNGATETFPLTSHQRAGSQDSVTYYNEFAPSSPSATLPQNLRD